MAVITAVRSLRIAVVRATAAVVITVARSRRTTEALGILAVPVILAIRVAIATIKQKKMSGGEIRRFPFMIEKRKNEHTE